MNEDKKTELIITSLLADCSFFQGAKCYYSLGSTNDKAAELARNGAPEGTVVIAKQQTAGRGRMGRHFYSPADSGLYMSLILRPGRQGEDVGLLTAGAAVAVFHAIKKLTDVSVQIKWVNDLYYNKKKLCGILAEGQLDSSGHFSYVILGVGINLYPPSGGYASEINGKTTSLAEISPTANIDSISLCACIVEAFSNIYKALPNRSFLEIYRSQSCVLGQTISYQQAGVTHMAKAVAIDDQAHLVVQDKHCNNIVLKTGEINMIRPIL